MGTTVSSTACLISPIFPIMSSVIDFSFQSKTAHWVHLGSKDALIFDHQLSKAALPRLSHSRGEKEVSDYKELE